MKLELDANGFIPANYPRRFYRVEAWGSGRRIADYTTEAEASHAARASVTGARFDHKVCVMTIESRHP